MKCIKRSLRGRRPSAGTVLGIVALIVALGGTAQALQGKNKVRANDIATKIRSDSVTFASGAQIPDNGSHVHSPVLEVKCKAGEKALAGGTSWSFDAPTDPSNTPTELEFLTVKNRSVVAQGGSDTDSPNSTFTVQVVCVKR